MLHTAARFLRVRAELQVCVFAPRRHRRSRPRRPRYSRRPRHSRRRANGARPCKLITAIKKRVLTPTTSGRARGARSGPPPPERARGRERDGIPVGAAESRPRRARVFRFGPDGSTAVVRRPREIGQNLLYAATEARARAESPISRKRDAAVAIGESRIPSFRIVPDRTR